MSPLVFVRFFPKHGQEGEVERILRGMVEQTRKEPGCHRYDLHRSTVAPSGTIFCLVERYADEEAIQAHRETSHYKDYRARIMDRLDRPIDVTILEPLDERAD